MADNYNRIPKENARHSLVGRVLRTRSTSQEVLCTHKNINQWSYFKPVRSPLHGEIPSDDREQMFLDTNDGFTIPVFDSPKEAAEALEDGSAKWTYNKPRGGDYLEYFRIDDFEEYEHTQPDWFEGWSGLHQEGYAGQYRCYLPDIPVVGFYGMISQFAAWPKTPTSDKPDGESLYRFGLLAWIVGDTQKKAYFVNFGKVSEVQDLGTFIDTAAPKVPLGVDLKIAPVVTSYGFGSDDLGITDPEKDGDEHYIATWNECSLDTPSGSSGKYFFEKTNGWWIMPVEPVSLHFDENSGTVTRPGLTELVQPSIIGYPSCEPVYVEGVYTGCRVYLKLNLVVNAMQDEGKSIDVEVNVRVNPPQISTTFYKFKTTVTQQNATIPLPVAPSETSWMISRYSPQNSGYDSETNELWMFIPKKDYLNGGIQVEVNVWAKWNYGKGEGEMDIRPQLLIPPTI